MSAFLSLGSQSSRSEKMEQRRQRHGCPPEAAMAGDEASGEADEASGLRGHGEWRSGTGMPMEAAYAELGLSVEDDGEVKSQGNACMAAAASRQRQKYIQGLA